MIPENSWAIYKEDEKLTRTMDILINHIRDQIWSQFQNMKISFKTDSLLWHWKTYCQHQYWAWYKETSQGETPETCVLTQAHSDSIGAKPLVKASECMKLSSTTEAEDSIQFIFQFLDL